MKALWIIYTTRLFHIPELVSLSDECLEKFYHIFSQYEALFFDANVSSISPLPWLRW